VVRLIVWDTGIGIPAQQQALLFQPFVQLDSKLSRKYQGTGLGLFLVDSMTKLHGGKVEIESEEGKGSKFTVTLPWENSDEQMSDSTAGSLATEWQPAAAAILSSESGLKAKRILLADDDEKNRFIYSEYLRSKGYLVETATNGVEALEAAVTKNPNLILMDVQMPEMDGLEAIRKLRELPQFLHIPIIALTALAMEGDSEHCLEAGADLYLSKPVPLKVLLATVMEALDDNC
jgi:CheY-like chemotaxis protein